MTRILTVEKKRGVAVIGLEDATVLRIPGPLFRERRLQPGEELDAAQHLDWLRARAHGFALDAAVAYLAARPRTVREVERRLEQAGYEADTVAGVVERLRREGYLNDAEFADQWVQSRSVRALGARRLSQELQKKGVGRDTAHAALAQVDPQEQLRVAAGHAAKLLARTRGKGPDDIRRKVLQALLRRGYDWDTARAALQAAGAEAPGAFEAFETFEE